MTRPSRGSTSPTFVARAREFRQGETPAEEVLWKALRGRQLAGLKFRRQHPYGHLILDFFCVERRLAVEVDGSVHDMPARSEHDRARDEYLSERDIRVLHIPNEVVANDLPTALALIVHAAGMPHPPTPSPDDRK